MALLVYAKRRPRIPGGLASLISWYRVTVKKRLSVFISSTYEDLRPERDAALRAVLEAGHTPAGMELFAAGSASQLETIKTWIDSCDAYMLILGGRYGSIEPDSNTGYVELEYDYALSMGKPVFAIVLSGNAREAKARELGTKATDEHGSRLNEFRKRVLTKIAANIEDTKDLRAETFKALAEISQRDDVVGWVSGDEVRKLHTELATLREGAARVTKSGAFTVTSDMMLTLLENESVPKNKMNVAEWLAKFGELFAPGLSASNPQDAVEETALALVPKLLLFQLVKNTEEFGRLYMLTETGRAVIIRAKAKDARIEL
jgi:hypothetical protein